MKVRCLIGSLRLNDGTEYSKGDVFSLDDEKTVRSLLRAGYAQEAEDDLKKIVKKTQSSRR